MESFIFLTLGTVPILWSVCISKCRGMGGGGGGGGAGYPFSLKLEHPVRKLPLLVKLNY